jgi:hypothetical protein
MSQNMHHSHFEWNAPSSPHLEPLVPVVVYTVAGFLDKNRDVMQDQLFDYMRDSSVPFIRSVTKFQNMLEQERKVVMAAKISRKNSEASVDMRTNKVSPPLYFNFFSLASIHPH